MSVLLRLIVIIGAVALVSVAVLWGLNALQGDACAINTDEVVNGDLVVLCGELVIAGSVNGNVITAALEVEITHTGTVNGSIYALAPRLLINGLVTEHVRFAGYLQDGRGFINGDRAITRIDPIPELAPNLSSPTWFLETAARALREFIVLAILGMACTLLLPERLIASAETMASRPFHSLGLGLASSLVVIPALLIVVAVSALLFYLIGQLNLPDLSLIAGVLLGGANAGIVALAYFFVLFFSRAAVAAFIGGALTSSVIMTRWRMSRLNPLSAGTRPREFWTQRRELVLMVVFGSLVLAILEGLPFIGWFVQLGALLMGFGALIASLVRRSGSRLASAPNPPPLVTINDEAFLGGFNRASADARRLPPPIPDDTTQPPGMNNLPDGFKWWE